MHLFLFRHTESGNNINECIGWKDDCDLTENWIIQGGVMGKYISHIPFSRIIHGPLLRTTCSAQIIHAFNEHSTKDKPPLIPHPDADDRNFWIYNWKSKLDIKRQLGVEKIDYPALLGHPDSWAETHEQLAMRTKRLLDEIVATYKNEIVLVVTHAIIVKRLRFHMLYPHLGIDDFEDTVVKVDNLGIFHYELLADGTFVEIANNHVPDFLEEEKIAVQKYPFWQAA